MLLNIAIKEFKSLKTIDTCDMETFQIRAQSHNDALNKVEKYFFDLTGTEVTVLQATGKCSTFPFVVINRKGHMKGNSVKKHYIFDK